MSNFYSPESILAVKHKLVKHKYLSVHTYTLTHKCLPFVCGNI